jgi:hypothetical protein
VVLPKIATVVPLPPSAGYRYGACNNDVNWTPRPAAFVWQLASTFLWGSIAASGTGPASAQVALLATFDSSSSSLRTAYGQALWRAALGADPSFDASSSSSSGTGGSTGSLSGGVCVLVVINYSGAPQSALLQLSGWPGGVAPAPDTAVASFTVSEAGLTNASTTFGALLTGVAAPQDTVQFFVVPVLASRPVARALNTLERPNSKRA